MLQQVLEHIHNMFVKSSNQGTYTIESGTLSLPFLLDGQRLWIVGSVFNDGVYTYRNGAIYNDDNTAEVTLADETFTGSICALAVPKDVISLSAEIANWVDTYSDQMNSPFDSESVIGVYSYTKSKGASKGGSGNAPYSWQDAFKTRLDRWRKVSF